MCSFMWYFFQLVFVLTFCSYCLWFSFQVLILEASHVFLPSYIQVNMHDNVEDRVIVNSNHYR